MRESPLDDLRAGTAEENAATIRAVLSGERADSARDLVLANAAASLFVAGEAENLPAAAEHAGQVWASGAALAKLESFARLSNS